MTPDEHSKLNEQIERLARFSIDYRAIADVLRELHLLQAAIVPRPSPFHRENVIDAALAAERKLGTEPDLDESLVILFEEVRALLEVGHE